MMNNEDLSLEDLRGEVFFNFLNFFQNSPLLLQVRQTIDKMLNSAFRTSAFRAVSRQSFRYYSAAADGNPPVMAQIRDGLKAAMKAGNNVEKLVLRNIISEVKNRNINEPGSVGTDLKFVGMVRSLIATREKSIEEYQAANRSDLVDKEAAEIEILKKYAGLVPVASDADIDTKVQAIVDSLPEADRKSINKIMGKIPWKEVESSWNSTRNSIASSVKRVVGVRSFSTSARASNHSNPLVGN
jgi:uncharacterized protein YqeY